jgi:DNA-binding transcriptional ArsR family regulator
MLTEVFAALGDETRLHLVSRLLERPLSITELTAGSQITRQGITRHLRVMERAGIVHVERLGRESRWTLERRRLEEAQQYLELISKEWDSRLDRLRTRLES